jgi:Na+-driven multidrug efflux pump
VNLVTQAFSVLLNILLNLWLIPRYGILGAAWASLVSYSCEAVLITSVFVSGSGRTLRQLFVPQRADFESYRRRLSLFLRRFRAAP